MDIFTPKRREKEIISIRIPSDTLEKIDRIASKIDISRNEFIIEYALSNMDCEGSTWKDAVFAPDR